MHQRATAESNHSPEVVDPIWLIKALGITLGAALICGYLTVCLLFYQGQWQLILHPSRSKPAPSTILGTPFQTIRFGVDETASPQLSGWFVSAAPSARYAAYTLLYLPDGDGSLADSVFGLANLHALGINIFAADYRGYGQSAPVRPNHERMAQDAASVWQYLTVSRAIPGNQIILFGKGIGASLAAQLAVDHPEVPAMILETPRPELIKVVLADPRTKYLPVRALFHERFPIAEFIEHCETPKLFLLSDLSHDPGSTPDGIRRLTSLAAMPKVISFLPAEPFGGPAYDAQLLRFLDQYLHR